MNQLDDDDDFKRSDYRLSDSEIAVINALFMRGIARFPERSVTHTDAARACARCMNRPHSTFLLAQHAAFLCYAGDSIRNGIVAIRKASLKLRAHCCTALCVSSTLTVARHKRRTAAPPAVPAVRSHVQRVLLA